jgi:hypothetical protein
VRGSLLPLFKGFQHLFRTRTYGDVFGEIHPPDYSARINKKLCRARNICPFGSCAAMQQIVTPNHFRLWIRQECIGVAKLLALAPIDVRRVNTNRDDLNPVRFKFRKLLLETPQLGVTQWSPEPAIKNQCDSFRSANEITKRHVLPILIRQRKLGRFLSDSRRSGREWHLPQLIEKYIAKEPDEHHAERGCDRSENLPSIDLRSAKRSK